MRHPILLLVLFHTIAPAVAGDLWFRGRVLQHERPVLVPGSTVELSIDGQTVLTVPADDSTGCYSVYVDIGKVVQLHYKAPGYVTKSIRVDARNVPPMDAAGGFGMTVDIRLFEADPVVDVARLAEPMGRAAYDTAVGNMTWDMDYSGERIARLAALYPQRYPTLPATSACWE